MGVLPYNLFIVLLPISLGSLEGGTQFSNPGLVTGIHRCGAPNRILIVELRSLDVQMVKIH